jgi:hypothetical protein
MGSSDRYRHAAPNRIRPKMPNVERGAAAKSARARTKAGAAAAAPKAEGPRCEQQARRKKELRGARLGAWGLCQVECRCAAKRGAGAR